MQEVEVEAKRSMVGIGPRWTVLRFDGKPLTTSDVLVFPGDCEMRGRWMVKSIKYENDKVIDFELTQLPG
jgi:hypothetical protein